MHIIELDRRAVAESVRVVARVAAGNLDRPTPCAQWTLGDLLAHMTAQHRGFAAAARGTGADPRAWEVLPLGDDPVAAYTAAADDVVAAFAGPGVADARFALPEFSTEVTFRGVRAVGFHFLDYVVHTWDVARSLGVHPALPPELVTAALPIAEAVPDGPGRAQPGAPFAPRLSIVEGATDLDRLLALVGRAP
ncbi:TIGR03086 family metal-binding protein [Virgisporangium ochraceum]